MTGPLGVGGVGVTGVCGVEDELDPHPPTRASAAAISSKRPDDTVHYQPGARESLTIRCGSHEICNGCEAVLYRWARESPVRMDWRELRNGIRLMGYAAGFVVVVMGVVLGFVPSGQQVPGTLRAALLHYGFESAIHAPEAPKIDAPLTSSEFGVNASTFAAAYYLRNELQGQALGRLHVSVFDRTTGRWRHATLRQQVGSVLAVKLSERYILIEGHASPSAGVGLLLNQTHLRTVSRLSGYGLRFLPDSSILYRANMVHFAPVHQERLMVFDPKAHREAEIFPGRVESAVAASYRRKILATYERLSAAQQAAFEQSAYGALDDFDRSISYLAERPTGDRLAFVASYESNRMDKWVPRVQSLVHCARTSVLVWSCSERDLDEAARALAFEMRRQPSGWFESADIDPLIKKVLGL
jgi:hypothetical protein